MQINWRKALASVATLCMFVVIANTALFATPSITSLSATSGTTGMSITIRGSGFGTTQGTGHVQLEDINNSTSGATAQITTWSDTAIVAVIPSFATCECFFQVFAPPNGGSNKVTFTLTNPLAYSVEPAKAAVGDTVTIWGTNFGQSQGTSTLTIGGIAAHVTTWNNFSIVAAVPSGAGTGGVVVTVGGLTATQPFTVSSSPLITLLSQSSPVLSVNSAPAGQDVTITGVNFGVTQGSSTVTFNGTQAIASFWSDTSITASVPANATSGNVVVKVGSTSSNGVQFAVTPAPVEGGVGFVQGNYSNLPHTNDPTLTNSLDARCFQSPTTGFVISSIPVSFPLEQKAGDLNLVVVAWHDAQAGATPTLTDSLGNTYQQVAKQINEGDGQLWVYFAPNILGGTNSVQVQWASSHGCAIGPEVRIAEYRGLSTATGTGALDISATNNTTGSATCDSGFATTTNQYDMLIGLNLANKNTTAPGTNYTTRLLTTQVGSTIEPNILEDRLVTATGSYDAQATMAASGQCMMQMFAFKEAPNAAPVVNAGPNQTIILPNSVTLDGSVSDDGLPTNTLTISWSKVSGPGTVTFSSPNTANTQATFSTFGTYVLQLTANDSQLSTSSNVTITVNSQAVALSLALSAPLAGPNVTGTTQKVAAVLTNGTGPTATPISGVSVSFTVTGANATTGSGTTDSTGTATFTYTGANSGSDTVQATYTGQNSNAVSVNWLVPSQTISTTTVFGQFFLPDNPPAFTFDVTPSTKPAFTQWFPNIAFNPPNGAITGSTSVGPGSQPFTDVVTDQNGNFSGTIIAQGNGFQAGLFGSPLAAFQAVFTGSYIVKAAGNSTITIYVDNAFILGIDGGAKLVSGPVNNPPAGTELQGLPVIASASTNIGGFAMTINFPTPGTYHFELDYLECCGNGGGDTMSLVMMNGDGSTSGGIAPSMLTSGSIALTPLTPSSLPAGQMQTQTFTALATNAAGFALPNINVNLVVTGANARQLSATTDSTGHATFQYAGTNAGTDTVQASAILFGMGAYSNQVSMKWTVASGGTSTVFVPQGWIASPLNGATIQGSVPVTLISTENLTSGTLTFFPTSNPSAVTTLKSGLTTTGGGTLGTFDGTMLANGGYTIQLNATDTNNNTQVSQVNVTVVGNYKPGRLTSTVTEFTVPLAGIPITISRTYDSLERNQLEDFGFGWKLNTSIGLTVDAQMNVTLNINGQRQTFFFQPQPSSAFFGWLLTPTYVPQPGLHGTLISNGCGAILNVQGSFQCFGPGTYQPTLYAYTDPVGRTFTVSSSGQLQSIQDLNGNTLTVTANGISSSVNGVVIPFTRTNGLITQIKDLNNNPYVYTYDSATSTLLQSVQYPGVAQPESYTYFDPTCQTPTLCHVLKSETDPNGNTSSSVYYSSANDGGNTALDGRLQSITDGMPTPDVWSYTYNLSTNTTTTTNPDSGTVSRTDDALGNPLSITEQVTSSVSRTTTYQYDSKENLIHVTDACGNGSCPDTSGSNHTTTYGYDANGFQTSVQDQLGHTSTKLYNQFGGVTRATDAANTNTQITTYFPNFNPQQVTDQLNGSGTQVASYTFDSLGNLQTYTDANGKLTTNNYDPSGNLIQVTDALNDITKYTYDPMNRLKTQTDPLGNVTTFAYDALGHLKTKTDAMKNLTQYFYDNNGNKNKETDANNNNTLYGYDALNRVNLITYQDTTTKHFTYDFRGNKLTETDQAGHVTNYVYDLAGELTSVTYAFNTPDAATVHYTYDLDGRLSTVTDELSNLTQNFYDAAGNLTSVKDAATPADVTNYGYDADNRRTSVQDANQNTTTYAYDARSRLSTITYPIVPPQTQATTTVYTYDGMGRLRTTKDQAGLVTTNAYDDVGRLITVTDAMQPTGNVTTYKYDFAGNLRSLIDAAGRITTYQYDPDNRRALRQLPLGQTEIYTYDPVGNLHTKTDFNGKITTYTYDTLNRLSSKVPDPSLNQTTIGFTYTPTGKRLTMTDPSGTTNYTSYDNRDRLKTKATPEGTLNYTYDAHSNLTTLASSNTKGASLAYTYDALNRIKTVCDKLLDSACSSTGPGVTTYGYDAVSNLQTFNYPNTMQTQNVFDQQNRLSQTCAATSTPACSATTKLASYNYTLGNAGNRTNVLEASGRSVAYVYDNDYRLKSETITSDQGGNNGAESYNYDVVGNRTSLSSTIPALPGGITYAYDDDDRLSTDSYDANGNTIKSAGIANTYDFENRILTHGAVTYVYDGDGNRVSETVGGTTTKYLVDDLNPTGLPQVLDEIVNGSVTRTYVYGAIRLTEDQIANGTVTPSFYGYDGHGNVRFLVNASGAVTDTYDYDAFGMSIKINGATPNPYFFSGERLDAGTGLYDLRARYYNQATGRFWARDPVEGRLCCGLSWNPYIYVRQNPVNWLDPTGRDLFETVLIQGGSAVSATEATIAVVGGTAVEIADFIAEVSAEIAEIQELLAEAAADAAAGLFDAAGAFIEEAVHVYLELLAKEGLLGGIVRALTCAEAGLIAAEIVEYSHIPKWAHTVEIIGVGTCAVGLELK